MRTKTQQLVDTAMANPSRANVIAAIRTALRERSGKAWSVTGGRGTAYGWITIDAPAARRTWDHRPKAGTTGHAPEDYEAYDSGVPDRSMSPADQAELARLLGNDRPVHIQGESIPAGHDFYRLYVQKAATGKANGYTAEAYWD